MLVVGDFENVDDAFAEAGLKAKGRGWKEGTFKMHFENVEDEDEEMILKLN
jgi:hypothetical protein